MKGNEPYLINSRFSLIKQIGAGTFSNVFVGEDLSNKRIEVAIKIGKNGNETEIQKLTYEAKLLSVIQSENPDGFPRILWLGEQEKQTIMVMDILGPSLEDLFAFCENIFDLKTVLLLAEKMIERIEYLHSKNFIHRDIKPENFFIGSKKRNDIIYLSGLANVKRYFDPRSKTHIAYQFQAEQPHFSPRFCSFNVHMGIEQSRRDDLESLAYSLIYFLKRGKLPWNYKIIEENQRKRLAKILELKQSTRIEEICDGLPEEFAIFLKYCRNLRFEEKPDYRWIKRLFQDLYEHSEFKGDPVFSWVQASVEKEKGDLDDLYLENEVIDNQIEKIDENGFNQ